MTKQNIEKEDFEEISLRSEEVQDLMGRVPSWIEQWGITVIAILLAVLLTGAFLFPYPDTMTGRFIMGPRGHDASMPVTGHALLPVRGIGKVKRGQDVIVRLDNYPDEEFGTMKGNVQDISCIPNENGMYQIAIQFPDGLETSEGFHLQPDMQMSGTAEIIVRERRLIEMLRPKIIK